MRVERRHDTSRLFEMSYELRRLDGWGVESEISPLCNCLSSTRLLNSIDNVIEYTQRYSALPANMARTVLAFLLQLR